MSGSAQGRYLALLRGINVGKAKQLAMADLKRLLEGLGYADVRTHLRSGQAVFTADGPATATGAATIGDDIEQAITEGLGMDVRVVVRTRAELAKVIKANPLATSDRDPAKLFCVFLSAKLTATDLRAVDPSAYEPEEFTLGASGREIFLWLPNGMGTSQLGVVKWDRVTGNRQLVVTARNWRTTLKLLELLDA
ncbi:MAG: DUF1697 domain-containing protein [Actinomycetota bacterium]|nr:DUF1697 domain-containing protein [Actinomycetota bacterium]